MTEPNEGSLDNTPLLSDKTYGRMRDFVQLWLPAAATLYFTLALQWGLPNPEGVVASAAAIATFLGVVLKISVKSYENSGGGKVGVINVNHPTPDSMVYSLELNGDPKDLQYRDTVTFKVNQNSGAALPPPDPFA